MDLSSLNHSASERKKKQQQPPPPRPRGASSDDAVLVLASTPAKPVYVTMRKAGALMVPSSFFDSPANNLWNQELFTSAQSQLTAKVVPAGERIDFEVHSDNDQYFFVQQGMGTITVSPFSEAKHDYDDSQIFSVRVEPLCVVVVPAGTRHEVAADADAPLMLLSVYVPPHHPRGARQRTKHSPVEKPAEDE